MKKLLDLSKPTDWLKVTKKVVNKTVSAALIPRLRDFDHEEMYSDTLSYLLEGHDEPYSDSSETLTDTFEEQFFEHYSHIRAFHACRLFLGEDSYRQKGIRKASTELLRELAHAAFGAHCDKALIDKAVDEYEISKSDRSVYLFTDDWNAKRDCQNHYLQSGSELLQAISIELNLHSRGILAKQASPCLIECNVPINHVSAGFRDDLWRNMVTLFFKYSAGRPKLKNPMDFCIRVTKDIAPASIVTIHALEDSNINYTLPRH